jgi:hypothetical protein
LAPTVGIAATGFCYPGGILQLFHRQDQQIFHRQDQQIFHRKINKFFGYQQQQPDRFNRSEWDPSSSSTADATDSSSLRESAKSFGAYGHCQIASEKSKSDSRRDQITVLVQFTSGCYKEQVQKKKRRVRRRTQLGLSKLPEAVSIQFRDQFCAAIDSCQLQKTVSRKGNPCAT